MKRTLLILLVVVVVGALAAGVVWVMREKPAASVTAITPLTSTQSSTAPAPSNARTTLDSAQNDSGSNSPSSVVFPLEVEMQLMHLDSALSAPGVASQGSGAKAQLAGTITGPRREPVRAQIEFIAGANQGRILYCDGSGAFGAQDLYPGLSIVTVTGPGIVGSQREVLLRSERQELLNIGYVLPAHVIGDVMDAASKPIVGATVTIDGQVRVTDDAGRFEIAAVAPGNVLVEVWKPGYADYREKLSLAVNGKPDASHLQYRLEAGASLQVSVLDTINKGEQAWLYILPSDVTAQRKFPWYKDNPRPITPGGTARFDDLPSGMVSLRLFHSGAIAKPERASVMLGAGETANAEFHLEPAPVLQGVITDGGVPAVRAEVVLEAPDHTKATLSVLGESNFLFLESEVFPNMPPAVQRVTTNGRGEFVLNANEAASGVRYLTATSQDGKRTASTAVQPGATKVDLTLAAVQSGKSVLRIVMNGRNQPLPVKISVNGTPREQRSLGTGRDLLIDELPAGSWLVTARWNGETLVDRKPVQLDGEVAIEVQLPEGALLGQDADTIHRAGH